MRKMNKRVLLEKKTLGTKGKYEALDYIQKNLSPYKKKREKNQREGGEVNEKELQLSVVKSELKSLVG